MRIGVAIVFMWLATVATSAWADPHHGSKQQPPITLNGRQPSISRMPNPFVSALEQASNSARRRSPTAKPGLSKQNPTASIVPIPMVPSPPVEPPPTINPSHVPNPLTDLAPVIAARSVTEDMDDAPIGRGLGISAVMLASLGVIFGLMMLAGLAMIVIDKRRDKLALHNEPDESEINLA